MNNCRNWEYSCLILISPLGRLLARPFHILCPPSRTSILLTVESMQPRMISLKVAGVGIERCMGITGGLSPFIMPFQDIYLLYPISTRLSGKTCMLTIPKYKTTCLTDRLTLVDWNNSSDPTKKGRLFAHGRGGFRLHAAGRIRSGLQPHRILSITINDYGDERCPSVSELVSLVSWMLASMNYQTLEKTKKRPSRSHEIFPVCFFFLFLFLLFF